jgi:hypothetical protein
MRQTINRRGLAAARVRWWRPATIARPAISAVVGAIGVVAGASNAVAEAGWTDYAVVTELTPTIHQRYEVTIAFGQNPSGCRNKQIFFQDYSVRGSEQMYLALLESVSSGKRVRVFVTGVCGVDGYSQISAVGIRP